MKVLNKQRRITTIAYSFMFPFLLVFVIFTVVPVFAAIILSFTNFNMLQVPLFIGFKNYMRLFLEDDIYQIAIKNTFLLAMITGPISYIISFIFAWFLNELSPKVRSLFTLCFYAPSLAGTMSVIWAMVFSGDRYGILNGMLIKLGFIAEPIVWLKDTQYMTGVVIAVVLWSSLGTSFLAFIAGFQNLDRSLYEAGSLDGIKNRWQELYFITLPLMRPQLLFGAVINISASFGIGSVITGLVGFPSTNYALHTLVHHLEDYGSIRYEMGYSCAIATLLFLIMILTNKLVQKMLSRIGV